MECEKKNVVIVFISDQTFAGKEWQYKKGHFTMKIRLVFQETVTDLNFYTFNNTALNILKVKFDEIK